jgi:hypothetical protein
MPFYCFTCEQDFAAAKKEELETASQYLSFEVITKDQNLSFSKLSGYRPNILKRFGPKRKER